MDFLTILTKEKGRSKSEGYYLYPEFAIEASEDLMIKGRSFYAFWNEAEGLWSQSEFDLCRLIDEALYEERSRLIAKGGGPYSVKNMKSHGTGSWSRFLRFCYESPDNWHPLNTKVVFANTPVKKTDYASWRLPYAIEEGPTDSWDELISTLYRDEERDKIEWAIGSIIAGDSKSIQKFFAFYGPPGTGKSTAMNIIGMLFDGYSVRFNAKDLGSSNGSFAMEPFRDHPLVAIEHDTDLSRIEDNSRLNTIISHEEMTMNEKYKPTYSSNVEAMLFVGSNQPVKISDAKSGIIRRLIDIHPTGVKVPINRYNHLMNRIGFELGAIAFRCWTVYTSMGKNYYNGYRPLDMILQTDVFFNFIEEYFDLFKSQDYTTLDQAWTLYKEYCEESGITKRLLKHKVREELKSYFSEFQDRGLVGEERVRSIYLGFTADKFRAPKAGKDEGFTLLMEETESLLDVEFSDQPAQLAKTDGTPSKPWSRVRTQLSDIDTGELHYLKVPEELVVIDFDLQEINGTKALERNLEAASLWPPTYAEISKSGSGIHLHYIYTGDVAELAPQYAEGIEVKTYRGNGALRRRLSRCNAVPISTISGGLPLKEKKEKMLKSKTITSEQGLRALIQRNLDKEFHAGTKPSVDFIKKILDDAYESGMKYDVSDLRTRIMSFANNSTNQAPLALKVVKEMKWKSEDSEEVPADVSVEVADDRLAFFDVEVYPNLFVVCWKFQGDDKVVRMINPKAKEVAALFNLKLVGFNNRRFDNHVLYAASMGATNDDLFRLTQKLVVDGNRSAAYGAAYNLSYADILDFSSEKMSLKKFEIKLGILHMELDLPWDKPVDKKDWKRVVDYCANDVEATEAVFEDRKGDFIARQILAELSGLSVNDTTQAHTAKIIFGNDKHPQRKFVYTDLSEQFKGYKFELGKSTYRGEEPGEGGYVYAEPGIYENVAVLDIVSMHPTTIEILNLFGPYTKNFSDLKKARVAIKHGDWDLARNMMDTRLAPYLEDESTAEQLAYALKIVINTVYGLTSAKFDNPFRDIRNIDNIVAKRGALFMIDLKHDLMKNGYQVAHIKTDSVKIPNATPEAIAAVKTLGSFYGYEFEHEATYDRFCLVNDAVYVGGKAKVPWDGEFPGFDWTAVGAQFQHPVVFKWLFLGEEPDFFDFFEARSVLKGAMYLCDPDSEEVKEVRHVGKTGQFVPVLKGGYLLYRKHEDKYYSVSGTKNHLWMEAHIARDLSDKVEIDMSYYEKLRDEAIATIEKFGSFHDLVH